LCVSVRATPEGLAFGVPVKLNVPIFGERDWGTQYDVSLDGRRVVFPYPGFQLSRFPKSGHSWL